MEFEALDGIKLVLLMGAGLLFAMVGLYLLVRPKPEGSAAKIEIFGLKFESSSAGLLVFLIGAAFLAIPLFVAEKVEPEAIVEASPQTPDPSQAVQVPKPASPSSPAVSNPASTAPISTDPVIEETEPNNGVRNAQPIRVGQTMSGIAGHKDQDWFELQVPPTGLSGHEIRLRYVSGVRVRADIYDAREENVGFLETGDGSQYLPITSDFLDKLYFRVKRDVGAGEAHYELTVLAPGQN